LFVDNNTNDDSIITLRITEIEPNKDQPRRDFDDAALAELADSIKQHGVLQPLLVRPLTNGRYQIVAGERRWRASRMAGLAELPVVIKEMTDNEAMELALIENLQRQDLNPVEEALGYKVLMEQYNMTQEQVANSVGKSRPVVANALRLLNLPDGIVANVRSGKISVGHAKAMLAIEDKEMLQQTADKIISKGMTVREVEQLAKKQKFGGAAGKNKNNSGNTAQNPFGDNFFKEMQLALSQEMGRKITIIPGKNKGTLQIEFYDKEDLSQLAKKLTSGLDSNK